MPLPVRALPWLGLAAILLGGCVAMSSTSSSASTQLPRYQSHVSSFSQRIEVEVVALDTMTPADLRDHAIYYAAKAALNRDFDRFYIINEVVDTVPHPQPPTSMLPPHALDLAPPPEETPRIRLSVDCLQKGEVRLRPPPGLPINAARAKSGLGYRLHIQDFG